VVDLEHIVKRGPKGHIKRLKSGILGVSPIVPGRAGLQESWFRLIKLSESFYIMSGAPCSDHWK